LAAAEGDPKGVKTQRDFDEAIAGDDDDDDCGRDESVCDTFDDHLTYD
jgi:hypothetical protein